MKVALATPIDLRSFGGTERKLVEIAEGLVKKGCDVSIHALSYAHPRRKVKISQVIRSLKRLGIEYYEAKRHKVTADVAYVVYAPLIWRKFKLNCPSIAGLHSPLLFSSNDGITTFLNPFFTIKRYSSFKYMATFWLSNLIKNLDLAGFNAVRALSRVFKVKHRYVYYVPEWVDSKVFRPRSDGKDDNFTVFFSGRHHWEKGFDVFLKVATTLKERGFGMRFMCTGKSAGPAEGLGFADDETLVETYSRSHVVLYPSRMDTFGNVIVEAAGCGTPVITTSIPAHVSLGLPLIYADNIRECVEGVVRIYNMWTEHTSEYNEFARKHREWILKFDTNEVFPRFERMLREVANADLE